jgi:hypothetical protein
MSEVGRWKSAGGFARPRAITSGHPTVNENGDAKIEEASNEQVCRSITTGEDVCAAGAV